MASIKTVYSAVDIFAVRTSSEYSVIINIAQSALSVTQELSRSVAQDSDKLAGQIGVIRQLQSEAEHKAREYEAMMNEAGQEVDYWEGQIAIIQANPKKVTVVGSDGREETMYVVDEAALQNAIYNRDRAMQVYTMYEEKFKKATELADKAASEAEKYSQLKRAVDSARNSIDCDAREISNYLSIIANEAEYNRTSLQSVLDSLGAYLASKQIYVPEKSSYERFFRRIVN